MSEEDRLKLENELLLTKSKAQMINLYLDLQQKVEQLENIRKETIELIKKYQRKDEFLNLNEWQTRDLLNILNKGENNGK